MGTDSHCSTKLGRVSGGTEPATNPDMDQHPCFNLFFFFKVRGIAECMCLKRNYSSNPRYCPHVLLLENN